jgi:hypothetical protein
MACTLNMREYLGDFAWIVEGKGGQHVACRNDAARRQFVVDDARFGSLVEEGKGEYLQTI